jgi:hypothetical protein
MTASDSFNLVTQSNKIDTYLLLPSFSQAMTKEQKLKAVEIVKSHSSSWDVHCLSQLQMELLIPVSDLPSLQLCIWSAIDNPSHLERGMEDVPIIEEVDAEVKDVKKKHKTAQSLPKTTGGLMRH